MTPFRLLGECCWFCSRFGPAFRVSLLGEDKGNLRFDLRVFLYYALGIHPPTGH